MAHDVFISHSSKDKPTADAVCALLESDGLRCWIAPRDVQAGVSYAGAIIDAINDCRAMVLIFSDAANASPQIEREIERAANRRIPLLPFRIEDVTPQRGLEYFLSTPHWLDAFTPPLEMHIRELARQLHALLDPRPNDGAASVVIPAAQAAAPAPAKLDARPRSRISTGAMAVLGAVIVGGALAVAGTAVWLGGRHAPHAPPSSSAVASPAVASSVLAGPASGPPSASSEPSDASASAAAEAVANPPAPTTDGESRAGAGVAPGLGIGAIRPAPMHHRPPPFHPPPRRPRPLLRRHPRRFG